jgi:hypothetical protein
VILLMLRGINRIHKQLSGVLTTKSQLESIRIILYHDVGSKKLNTCI